MRSHIASETLTAVSGIPVPVLDGAGIAVLKGTLLLLLVFLLAHLARRAPAAARHLVWSLGLLGVLALPLLSAIIPWRLEILPPVPAAAARTFTASSTPPPIHSTSVTQLPAATEEPSTSPTSSPVVASDPDVSSEAAGRSAGGGVARLASWSAAARLASAMWGVGVILIALYLLVGMLVVRWTARRAAPLDDVRWTVALRRYRERLGVRAPVRLLCSERAAMPFTCGVLRPAIVLPSAAEEWSGGRRDAVLLHELAHVRRHDLLAQLLAHCACALYWFNPLAWIAARRLRAESERACDDLVLRAGTLPSDYADHLLQIVRAAGRSRMPAAALAMAQRSEFEGRLLAILEPGLRRHGVTRAGAAATVVAIALSIVPLAAMAPARGGVVPAASADGTINPDDAASADDAVAMVVKRDGTPRHGARTTAREEAGAGPSPAVDEPAGTASVREVSAQRGSATPDRAVSALAAVLEDDAIDVRLAAVSALGELEDPRAVDALAMSLRDDVAAIRHAAAAALGQIEDPRAVTALLEALRRDTDVEVRKMAAWALGEIESREATEGLTTALETERDAGVRARIVWALGQIEDPDAVDAVGDALRDRNIEVRRAAVWALGEIEDARGVDPLIPLLRDEDVEMRRQAAWALGQIESPRAVEALAAALQDREPTVREQAAWALGEIEDPHAAPALAGALRDESATVRAKAAWGLSQLDELRTAPRALIEAADDADREVRKAAVHALGEIEDPAAVPALQGRLRDADTEIRHAAVWALTEIRDPAALEVLLGLLKDADPEVRKRAAQALGRQR